MTSEIYAAEQHVGVGGGERGVSAGERGGRGAGGYRRGSQV